MDYGEFLVRLGAANDQARETVRELRALHYAAKELIRGTTGETHERMDHARRMVGRAEDKACGVAWLLDDALLSLPD